MGEPEHLLADRAVQAAVEALRLAERRLEAEGGADGDRQTWMAVTALIAFARANGSTEKVRALSEPFARARRRAHSHLTVVEG